MATQQEIDKFVHDQLSVWPEMAASFRTLKGVRVRQMPLGGLLVNVQCNPERISSTTADVSPEVIAARPCPICADHRPENQHFIKLEGRKGRKYDLIVNRFPIFPQHFVIVREVHEPQSIWNRYVDMLDMTGHLPGCVIFYNGPESGASIPDHLHFQAARKGYMPLERSVDRLLSLVSQAEGHTVPESIAADLEYVASVQDAQLFHYKHFTRGVFALRATTSKSMAKMFYRLLDCAPFLPGEGEPRFNALSWRTDSEYRAVVVLRSESRSHHYFATGEEHFTIGPGCADMAGCFILPDPADFDRLTPEILREVVDEVSISEETEKLILWRLVRQQPKIEVGILSGPEITFEIISDGAGPQKVSYREGKIDYGGTLYDELYFEAQTISTLFAEPSFKLHGVRIGKDFHWERLQEQTFAGTLKFIVGNGAVTAVNIIGLEDYLLSVISSEMRASASLEFLKAHAVISRSWAVAQLRSRHAHPGEIPFAAPDTPSLVTWLENAASSLSTADAASSLRAEAPKSPIDLPGQIGPRRTAGLLDTSATPACGRYKAGSREELLCAVACDWGKKLLDKEVDLPVIEGTYVDEGGRTVAITPEMSAYLTDELLQACRRRFYRPEYIACPGCGRTMYDLQGAFEAVKVRTGHFKDVVIAVMGCIVNGPGEMADADYGYVGEGGGKVTIYRGSTPVLRHVPDTEAVDKLVALIENDKKN